MGTQQEKESAFADGYKGSPEMSLPCVKGGGSRKRDGGIVKAKISS